MACHPGFVFTTTLVRLANMEQAVACHPGFVFTTTLVQLANMKQACHPGFVFTTALVQWNRLWLVILGLYLLPLVCIYQHFGTMEQAVA